MATTLVPATTARRRTHLCLLVVLLIWATTTVIAGYLMRSGTDLEGGAGPLTAIAVLILYLLPWLPTAGRARLEPGRRYLTARTICGRRTVDLHRLAKVGRRGAFTRGLTWDKLLLVDLDGVRLLVDDRAVDQAVKQALLARPGNAVRVSAAADERLNLSEPPVEPQYRWFLGRLGYLLIPLPLFVAQLSLVRALF